MDLEKNKQRLEIIAAELEELKRNDGGGGTPTESDDFTPDNITIEDGGTFPSGSTERLTKHLPLEINDTLYYFLEETGVDYLYGSLPTSGAFPTITYFRVMKGSFTVEFHQIAIETVPTEDSTNLITSGGVYTALQSAGSDLTPVNIGNYVETFPEEYRYLLQKRLPFKFTAAYPYTSSNWHGSWSVVSEDSTNYYCASFSPNSGSNAQTLNLAQFSVNKSTWAWSTIRPDNINSILIPSQIGFYLYGGGNINSVPSNSDLNSLTYGRYQCSATTAATLTNCPTTDGFQLLHYLVSPITPDFIIQQLTTFTANPVVYRRTKTSGSSWNPWYKFEGTVVS